MKSWLNSLILNWSGFSFKSVSVREQILPIQSNNDPFIPVSSLPALRLLRCCCSMAVRRRWLRLRRRVLLRTAERVGLEGLDGRRWTSLALRSAWSACQQWRQLWKPSIERDQPQWHYPDVAIRSSDLGQFSWRMLAPCWSLLHYANTGSFRQEQGASRFWGSRRSSILS